MTEVRKEELSEIEAQLKKKRPDLVGNPKEVRKTIDWFDRQLEDIVLKYPVDYERYGKEFLKYRNKLARYIGDPVKTMEELRVTSTSRRS